MSRLLRSLAISAACAAAVVVSAPALPGVERVAAAAQPRHRAAVIVDTGQEVKRVCVRFDEETISGAEILRRAGVDPVFATYGSMGEAVCSLCGVGCPSDNCFCDRSRYWSYSRAEDGRTTFTKSQLGASSTRVSDGDVEGWRWGTGAPPPFASVEVVCGEVAAATTTSTSTSPPPAAGSPPPSTTPRGGPGTPTSAPAAGVAAAESTTTTLTAVEGTTSTSTTPAPSDGAPVAAPAAAQRSSPEPDDEPGSSAPAVLVLVAAVAGLGGWWATLRRRRRA